MLEGIVLFSWKQKFNVCNNKKYVTGQSKTKLTSLNWTRYDMTIKNYIFHTDIEVWMKRDPFLRKFQNSYQGRLCVPPVIFLLAQNLGEIGRIKTGCIMETHENLRGSSKNSIHAEMPFGHDGRCSYIETYIGTSKGLFGTIFP